MKSYMQIKGILIAAVALTCVGVSGCDDDEPVIVNNSELVANGEVGGHEYVDLGLSVNWATYNVGANSPSDFGDYFAWGDTITKANYVEDEAVDRKSVADKNISGMEDYDVARYRWGENWRIPTSDEFQELVDSCVWMYASVDNRNGYIVRSPKTGNSIFLPAAGVCVGSETNNVNRSGYYWSSNKQNKRLTNAMELGFDESRYGIYGTHIRFGQSIRPVTDYKEPENTEEKES